MFLTFTHKSHTHTEQTHSDASENALTWIKNNVSKSKKSKRFIVPKQSPQNQPTVTKTISNELTINRAITLLVPAILTLVLTGDCVPPTLIHVDLETMLNNPDVSESTPLSSIFFYHDVQGFPLVRESAWRPLVVLTYRLQLILHGSHPSALFCFQVVNVCLHALCALLVSAICLKLFPEKHVISMIAGIFFGVHPSANQTLHFASGRGALMGTVFALGAVLRVLSDDNEDKNNIIGELLNRLRHFLGFRKHKNWIQRVSYHVFQGLVVAILITFSVMSFREGVVCIPLVVCLTYMMMKRRNEFAMLRCSVMIAIPLLVRFLATGYFITDIVLVEAGDDLSWIQSKTVVMRDLLWPIQQNIYDDDDNDDENKVVSNFFVDQRTTSFISFYIFVLLNVLIYLKFRRKEILIFICFVLLPFLCSDPLPLGDLHGQLLPSQRSYLSLAGLCVVMIGGVNIMIPTTSLRSRLEELIPCRPRRSVIFGIAAIVVIVLGILLQTTYSLQRCSNERQIANRMQIARSHTRRNQANFYLKMNQYEKASKESILALQHQHVFSSSSPSSSTTTTTTNLTTTNKYLPIKNAQMTSRTRAVTLHGLGVALIELSSKHQDGEHLDDTKRAEKRMFRDQAIFAFRLSLSQRSIKLHETMLRLALALLEHCEAPDEAEMYLRDLLLDANMLSNKVHTRALYALARRELCILSRRGVSVEKALIVQSSASNILRRALDLDPGNVELSSLIRKLNDATATSESFTLDRDVLIAAHGGTDFPWLQRESSSISHLYDLEIVPTTTQAWEKVNCPPPSTSPHSFMESVWPQVQNTCLEAQHKHEQLPPNPLVKMGIGPCIWLDHRVRIPFELDGRDQDLSLSLSDDPNSISELVCSIIGPDDTQSCLDSISNKIRAVQTGARSQRGIIITTTTT